MGRGKELFKLAGWKRLVSQFPLAEPAFKISGVALLSFHHTKGQPAVLETVRIIIELNATETITN